MGRGGGVHSRSEGQAEVWGWDLVAQTEDAPRKEGEQMLITLPFATRTVGLVFCALRSH